MSGMRFTHVAIPLAIVTAVVTMVVPIPPQLLDTLLAANITLAVLVLLAVLLLRDSVELSIFPSLLLVTTLFRLALNVSSTRLILLDAYAGRVIDTFGGFVVGGSIVVGLVVFLILIIIQFAVITAGAGRVAEVGARFTLDAMPGKQMAIDADLSAGLIDEHEAKRRRERIAQEADFHGAMDGASKFVKGDAIAGIVIVLINLIGGLAIGVGELGMTAGEAANTYSLLTVGDGLVSQIPALLLSLSTGMLVTRVQSDESFGPELAEQIFGNPKALRVAGGVIGALGLLPGLPTVIFGGLAAVLLLLSVRADRKAAEPAQDDQQAQSQQASVESTSDDPEALVARMKVEPLELHLSYDVLDLIDAGAGGDLLERVRALRQQIAMELGVVMPYVRTRDDVTLPQATYRIMLHGVEVGRGEAPRDRALALPAGDGSELRQLGGTETTEPVFGLTAYWITSDARPSAAATGATVVDRSSVIVTHLAEIVRSNAPTLLTRQQVQLLLEGLRADEPLLADEVGDQVPLPLLHQVLRELLSERVPVRDLARIVEAISSKVGETKKVETLTSAARVALGGVVTSQVARQGTLAAVTLDPSLEASFHEAVRDLDGQLHLAIDPNRLQALHEQARAAIEQAGRSGHQVAVVCSQMLRRPLKRALGSGGIDIPVLAYPELPDHITVVPSGVIDRAPAKQ